MLQNIDPGTWPQPASQGRMTSTEKSRGWCARGTAPVLGSPVVEVASGLSRARNGFGRHHGPRHARERAGGVIQGLRIAGPVDALPSRRRRPQPAPAILEDYNGANRWLRLRGPGRWPECVPRARHDDADLQDASRRGRARSASRRGLDAWRRVALRCRGDADRVGAARGGISCTSIPTSRRPAAASWR